MEPRLVISTRLEMTLTPLMALWKPFRSLMPKPLCNLSVPERRGCRIHVVCINYDQLSPLPAEARNYIMVYYGILYYIMVDYGMLWYVMLCYGMLWYIMIYYGILWYIMVYYGILWYIMVYYGILWCTEAARPHVAQGVLVRQWQRQAL